MSEKQLENFLVGTLKRLEISAQKIVQTRGYTKEAERIRMLGELIKEQVRNENTGSSARSSR